MDILQIDTWRNLFSEETRKKIGDRTRGRVLSNETRNRISKSKKGTRKI